MNKQIITGTMLQGSFFSVNKVVAKYLKSNDAALLLSHLIYLQEHHFKGEEFYQHQERLMEECNISMSVLRKCMNLLSEEDIIIIVRKKKVNDATPKNYYSINFSVLEDIFNLSSDQDSDHKRSTTIRDQETVSSDINILSSGSQNLDLRISRSCSQIIDKNKIDNTKVNKKEVNNKIRDNNIVDLDIKMYKLKCAGLYSESSKIPSTYQSRDEYINDLYNNYKNN